MCLPLAAAPLIAAGVSAAGTMIGGLQANAQGNYASKVARENAAMETEAARDSIERGKLESRSYWRDVGRAKGEQVAAMAANGVDVGVGSALSLQEDTADLADEDAGNLYRNIHERTRGSLINARNFVAEAKSAKQQGRAALVGSFFEAGSTLASSFSQQKLLKAKLGVSSRASG